MLRKSIIRIDQRQEDDIIGREPAAADSDPTGKQDTVLFELIRAPLICTLSCISSRTSNDLYVFEACLN